ncbi:MAG: hypothetical protein WD771_10445 [Gemmatimonadaceae bacterium]
MEILRHLRPFFLVVAAAALALPVEAQRRAPDRPAAQPAAHWPVKTREHVDLWLHGFALIQPDTATVPLFDRGYRERITILKNSRALVTEFDTASVALATLAAARPDLVNAHFLALYFGSWEELVQAFDYFFRADGDPRRTNNREVQGIVAFLAQYFPRPADRDFARRFVAGLARERAQFHHEWWLAERRARDAGLAAADSLWQHRWRPALQRYLNHTQQPSGDLILTLTLGGEGRALPVGKSTNQYAVAWPATADSAEIVLFTFAHEAIGSVAQVAVDDHLTPAQKRLGAGATYGSAGLVRGGALLVERVEPGMGERYARWYLAQMGRPVPVGGALAALCEAFPMPDEMIASMQRQIDISFGGI